MQEITIKFEAGNFEPHKPFAIRYPDGTTGFVDIGDTIPAGSVITGFAPYAEATLDIGATTRTNPPR